MRLPLPPTPISFTKRSHLAVLGAVIVAVVLVAGVGGWIFRTAWSGRAVPPQARAIQRYQAALDEKSRGNLDSAEAALREAVALDPANPEARRELDSLRRVDRTPERTQPLPAGVAPGKPSSQSVPKTRPSGERMQRASAWRISYYRLGADLDPEVPRLTARARVTLTCREPKDPRLEFSLNPEFEVRKLSLSQGGELIPATWRRSEDLLEVTPQTRPSTSEPLQLQVEYRLEGKRELKNGGGFISPGGTYLFAEGRWYPAVGELDFRAPVELELKVPKGYLPASVGMPVPAPPGTYRWKSERPAAMLALAVRRYVTQELQVKLQEGPVRVRCLVKPEHAGRAQPFLAEAIRIVRYLESRFGPYPYPSLTIAEIPRFPGGYGSTSLVMLLDAAFAEKAIDRELLAHEIAHQWWGNSVGPRGPGAAWLSEAFAEYSAWLYVSGEGRAPAKRAAAALAERAESGMETYLKFADRGGDQPIQNSDPYLPRPATEALIYQKGALVLHMLRWELGPDLFFRLLQTLYREHRDGTARIEEFRKLTDRLAGREMGWFFDQWLGRTGAARLGYSYRNEALPDGTTTAVVTLRQPESPAEAYRSKVKLVLGLEEGVAGHEVEVQRGVQEFRFRHPTPMVRLLVDPDSRLLAWPPRWETRPEPITSTTPVH